MPSNGTLAAALAASIVCFSTTSIHAQTRIRITASDERAGQVFGYGVAIHQDVAIVGAAFLPIKRARAYVFRSDGTNWIEETTLEPSAGARGRNFDAVDVNGDLAVASVDGSAAYVYRFSGGAWTEEAWFAPDGTVPGDRFGRSLAVGENRILVSAFKENEGSGTVHAYSFDGSAWQQEAKLVDPSPGILDGFGFSVALDGNVAVVGSFTSDDGLIESGSAHVFRHDGSDWQYEAKLVAPDAEAYDWFSLRLAIDGNWILVSSTYDDDAGEHTGSVHAYRWDGSDWVHHQKILPDDAHEHGYFGSDISVSGDRAVIAGYVVESVFYSFVFDGERWVQEAKYGQCEDVQCEQNEYFGEYVDISGDRVIVSSKEENGDAGAAYIYEFGASPTRNEYEIPNDSDSSITLGPNFPNPVRHGATITFRLSEPGPVRMSVIDVLGRERSVLINRELAAGEHSARFDAGDLENGTYFYRLTTDHTSTVRTFVVAR